MKLFKTKVTIGDKKYPVPERISVAQFEQVQSFGIDDAKSRMMCTAAIIGCTPQELMQLDWESQELAFTMACLSMQSLEEPSAATCPMQFDKMSFGDFIDLDVLTYEGINTHLADVIAIIWQEDANKIADQPLDQYLDGINEWMKKRDQVYRDYSEFFGLHENHEAKAEELGLDIASADIRRVWYQAVMTLAGEDFMKIHQVVERPINEAMNFLAYMKEQARQRELEHKRQMAKMKMK